VSASFSAISSIVRRVESIEVRFGGAHVSTPAAVPSPVSFEAFGEVYQRALEARPSMPAASMAARAARFVDAMPTSSNSGSAGVGSSLAAPPELAGYGNGRIPTDLLTPIQQAGHRLYNSAATAWDALVDAAAADGIDVRITDSYRSFENQVDLAERKGLYRDGGLAAVPGTSNHGWGLAVDADVTDPEVMAWLRERGPEFGWHEVVPREPWHWEYRPDQA
jgi:hypothetical protein